MWRQCQVYVNMTLDSPHGRWQVEHLSHSRHCRSPREAALGEIEWLVIASHWLGGNKCRSLGVEHWMANLKAVEIVRREMMDVEDWIKIARRSVPQSIWRVVCQFEQFQTTTKGPGAGLSLAGLFDWFREAPFNATPFVETSARVMAAFARSRWPRSFVTSRNKLS